MSLPCLAIALSRLRLQYGKLLWKYYTGEQIYCPASVDEDGTIYIGNYRPSNCLYALHPDKRPFGQQLKWKVCGEKNGCVLNCFA